MKAVNKPGPFCPLNANPKALPDYPEMPILTRFLQSIKTFSDCSNHWLLLILMLIHWVMVTTDSRGDGMYSKSTLPTVRGSAGGGSWCRHWAQCQFPNARSEHFCA